MKTVLQTQSIAWAQGLRVALEAERIQCAVLNEYDRGPALMPYIPVRVVVLDDDDLARAQAIAARLAPPRTGPPGPPPSWRWQKRGLLLLGLDVVLFGFWGTRLDAYQNNEEVSVVVLYGLAAVVAAVFVTGALFIVLGPRADRKKGTP